MILMKVHARTGPVAVAGLEKMLAKVPWLLGEVSLYAIPQSYRSRPPRRCGVRRVRGARRGEHGEQRATSRRVRRGVCVEPARTASWGARQALVAARSLLGRAARDVSFWG